MKIGLFSDTYPPEINGVATATTTLCKVLKNHGHEVIVVTTAPKNQKKITYENGVCRIPGIVMKRLYDYKLTWIWNKRVANFIKKFDLDIIHVQTEIGIGIFARLIAKKYKIPLVYTYHTMYEDYTYYVTKGKKHFDKFAKKVVAEFSKAVGDSSTEFTTTSEKTKNALRRYGVTKYINIVPNGVDMSSLKREKIDENELIKYRKENGLEDKFIILLLGRVAKEKSHDVVIDNVKKYINDTKDDSIEILVVGDGPDKASLENHVKEIGMDEHVRFIGKVMHERVPFFYALADLYCSASITETQGLTFNEAMAMQTPVLARYDDNLKYLLKDGVTGFCFDTPDSFVKKLSYIKQLDKESIDKVIKQAFDTNNDQFSLDKYYERMIKVYERAVRQYW